MKKPIEVMNRKEIEEFRRKVSMSGATGEQKEELYQRLDDREVVLNKLGDALVRSSEFEGVC